MNAKTKGLGRGLGAIFEIEGSALPEKTKRSAFEEIEIDRIAPNPKQPRTHFGEQALDELAESIRTLGVIQPITVRKEADGRYTIISGERRWRASKLAGLTSMPAYIREADEESMLAMAIVENIQRQDLNAIEVALSLQRLVDECHLTQDSLGERVGKKRSTVANYLRLLKLPVEVQLAVREELISMGHARALINLESEQQQIALLKKTIKKGLSVRQVEEAVKELNSAKPRKAEADEEFPESYSRLVEHLERLFTQEISIKKNNKGGGKIVIGFGSDDDIETFIGKLNGIEKYEHISTGSGFCPNSGLFARIDASVDSRPSPSPGGTLQNRQRSSYPDRRIRQRIDRKSRHGSHNPAEPVARRARHDDRPTAPSTGSHGTRHVERSVQQAFPGHDADFARMLDIGGRPRLRPTV